MMKTNRFTKLCWTIGHALGIVPRDELRKTVGCILHSDTHFLQGLQSGDDDLSALLFELSTHTGVLGKSAARFHHLLAANLRQTLLMTLIPANAFDGNFSGSIDSAVSDHLATLGVNLSVDERQVLRNICINIRRLRHLNSKAARQATMSLGDLRANPKMYAKILTSQNNRCIWCGVELLTPTIKMTLEHMAPKLIGDDPSDGSNWALACKTCNSGKDDLLSWASSPFANGYLRAKHFLYPATICRENRWIVLARERRCDSCQRGPDMVELGIYRQVSTGLPIPQHCSLTCSSCGIAKKKEVLNTEWEASENSRMFP
jgi:hypothetical protein